MKNHNLKSLLRTILGVFLLAAAVLCSTGFVSKDQVESKGQAESVSNDSPEAAFAMEIGGQIAPRNKGVAIEIYTPIGGIETPRTKLPRVSETTRENVKYISNAEGYIVDIGGQSAPKAPSGGIGCCASIGETEIPINKFPIAADETMMAFEENQKSLGRAESDIGGPQTPPREVKRPKDSNICLTKIKGHEHS